VDELVLAVPAPVLSTLIHGGTPGERIVEVEPRLAGIARLQTQRLPILHVCFKDRLQGIPAEPVGLFNSRLNIAFTDISQTWDAPQFGDRTMCAVSCSDPYGLTGAEPPENGHQILVELANYLKFEPGPAWERSSEIDWVWTRYHENWDTELSLNTIGTEVWRPAATGETVSNLSFAGDFCHQHVGLTTIESAVASGLEAVNAVVRRRGVGSEVEVLKPATRDDAAWVALRYALAPYALAAKAWSKATEHSGRDSHRAAADEASLLRYLLTPGLRARHQRFDR